MQQTLYLVRHCRAEGQEPDAPLTAAGTIEAETLATFLIAAAQSDGVRIERIVASPFLRAQQSIAPLARQLELPVEVEARLAERRLSTIPREDWLDQLRASFTDPDFRLEGGESSHEAVARAGTLLDEVRRHRSAGIVLVTHGNLLTLLLRFLNGYSLTEPAGFEEWRRLTNPDVFRVVLTENEARVERIWTG